MAQTSLFVCIRIKRAFNLTPAIMYTLTFVYLNFVNAKPMFCVKFISVLPFLMLCISQGSAVTRLRCGGKYSINFVSNFKTNRQVKEF